MARQGRLASGTLGAVLLVGSVTAAPGQPADPGQPASKPAASSHPSVEPAEAQLPPVEPAWKTNGWKAVVPHAYVLRGLAAARSRPEPGAPAVFWLKGGTKVPVLEQGRTWWRVGWSQGRTGWMPAAELEPHASWVLLDARTGRVQRRIAAKGQWGAVSDGRALWSLANTGITRTVLGERPTFWAYPLREDRDGSFPYEAKWTPDRGLFGLLVDRGEGKERSFASASVRTGEVRTLSAPAQGELQHVSPGHRILLNRITPERTEAVLYDGQQGREIRQAKGTLLATDRSGTTYVADGNDLIRFDPELRPGARFKLPGNAFSACLSADEKLLAVATEAAKGEEPQVRTFLLRAGTLAPVLTLSPGSTGTDLHVLSGGPNGWWILSGAEEEGVVLTWFNARGRKLRSWEGAGEWAASPAGDAFYLAREDHLLSVDVKTGTSRKIPFSWRRELPARYLPKPSEPSVPTHLDVSSLTISPDGRTLILAEWLNGDPGG